MASGTAPKLPGTPKPWMNAAMRTMLGLPVLRRLLGRALAVISVTGATTGTTYSTPVQFLRVGRDHVVLSQLHRRWWRNIRSNPEVGLTIAGRHRTGTARILEGDAAVDTLAAALRSAPRVARFYGLSPADDGTVAPADIEGLSERVVVIAITLDERSGHG